MQRTLPRILVMATLVTAITGVSTVADPPHPLDLARGLRENGLTDLALQYLDELAKKNPSPAVKTEIPLERARVRLKMANDENDENRRDGLIAQARSEFERFLSSAPPRHPRRPEAAISLARTIALQARSQVSRANQLEDPTRRKAEAERARAVFQKAADQFAQAAKEYEQQAENKNLTPLQRQARDRDIQHARLDRAIALFEQMRTYDVSGSAQDKIDRGKAIDEAQKYFRVLIESEDEAGWIARAWLGECEREKGSLDEAAKRFKEVKDAAVRLREARAGARLARFFELRADYERAFAERTPAAFARARRAIESWLNEPLARTERATPETYAAQFYLATCKYQEARFGIREDAKTKQPVISSPARNLLEQAEQDYRRLIHTENDYTTRAVRFRNLVVRLLIGEAEKDPAEYRTFDECVMAAQVQMEKADEAQRDGDSSQPSALKAVALLERARDMPEAREAGRELVQAEVNLTYSYLLSDKPYRAAVLGQHIAQTQRPASLAARGGYYSMLGYLRTASKLDPTDTETKQADIARALQVARFLDQRYPTDPSTDLARLQAGELLIAGGQLREAFDLLARVPTGSPWASRARLRQGAAAFDLLRPPVGGTSTESALTKAEEEKLYQKVVADLSSFPAATASASAFEARLSLQIALRLMEIHLTQGPPGYAQALRIATRFPDQVKGYTELPAEEKQEYFLRGEYVRARAVYGEAVTLFQAGKAKEAMNKMQPLLAELAKTGPAVAGKQAPAAAAIARSLDEFRRDRLIVLALQVQIRDGDVTAAASLLDLMKKLGGTLEASVGTLEQLIAVVKPQADALRSEGKTEEADRLIEGISKILEKVAVEPAIPPRVLVFLGHGLREIGKPDQAIELLKKVPSLPAEQLAKRSEELEEKLRPQALAYRLSRLEMARAYRQSQKFDEAEAILNEALGTAEKPGWAASGPDSRIFRRERAYFFEAKAAAQTDPKLASSLWAEARNRWTEMANDYAPTLKRLFAGKREPRIAMAVLLDLRALPPHDKLPKSPEEIRKALVTNPPPAWLTEILEPRKEASGEQRPNAYVEQMQNTMTRLESQIKPGYFDIVFESVRCLSLANTQLLKNDPERLAIQFGKLAQQMVQLEKANTDLDADLTARFAGLLAQFPGLRDEYSKQGGQAFLKAPTPTNISN